MSDGGINKIVKIVAVLILLPLSVLIPTLSLESYYAPPTNAQASESQALKSRTDKYRAALEEAPNTTEQQRIKLRCLAVQTNLKAFDARVQTVQTKRGEAYDTILAKLNELLTNLQNQAFDTTQLQQNVTALTEKTDNYDATMKTYVQALDDLTVIDCAKDPTSFKAALEVARTDHDKLRTSISDIRTFVTNTIKPQLQAIRTQLEAGQVTGGDIPTEGAQ